MLKNLKISSIVYLLVFTDALFANELKKEYLNLLDKMNNQICTNKLESQYEQYLRDFRGDGYYLPETHLGEIDKGTIGKYLPVLRNKILFVKNNIEKLTKLNKLPEVKQDIKNIEKDLKKLLEFKKDYFHTSDINKKENIKKNSKNYIKGFKNNYKNLLDKVFYLQSFDFPVDHLHNRHVYDSYNIKNGEKNKKRANETFFYRRIVEDGALDLDNQFPDLFLRTSLDTLTIAMEAEFDLLTENIRYDLTWILKQILKHQERGFKKQLERQNSWLKKSERTLEFYEELLKRENQFKLVSILEKRHLGSKNLKKLVFSKQAEVYKFWKDQSDLMKKIFVLDIILYSEVGNVDGDDALERKEVIEVVKNRVSDPFYSSLEPKQELFQYLKLDSRDIQKENYLNVMFKVGEFSFTYPYIIGVAKIFCPDMTSLGKKLREKNLTLIIDSLKHTSIQSQAVRYFSRESMLGRIDIATVWDDFIELPEKPGIKVVDQNLLLKAFQQNKFEYYYDFIDEHSVNYWVLNIFDKNYAMSIKENTPIFYKHRNPHQFKYFRKK